MKLWTWHKPDFSLLGGHVDHKRSEYVQTVERVAEAYRELAARISTPEAQRPRSGRWTQKTG
jgi:hypothetical protein